VSLSEYVLTELIQVAGRSTNAQILLRAALRPGSFSREEIEALDVPLVPPMPGSAARPVADAPSRSSDSPATNRPQ